MNSRSTIKSAPSSPEKTYYEDQTSQFRKSKEDALRASFLTNGRFVSQEVGWATFVFTKMCSAASSISTIQESCEDGALLDSFSIASLSRNIVDACIMVTYLLESLDKEKSDLRMKMIHLHDYSSRRRMFGKTFGSNPESELINFISKLKEEIRSNSFFCSLDEKSQERILSGQEVFIGGVRRISKFIWKKDEYELISTYLSQHTHNLPVSFHRSDQSTIDFKKTTPFQFILAGFALEPATTSLRFAAERIIDEFPDIAN